MTIPAPRMEQLIPVINRLQDVMSSVGVSSAVTGSSAIDLPQIAVVGSQSVGKSSVLESIVGRDFLPRGSGIVTRRPLILQLRNIQPPDRTSSEQTRRGSDCSYRNENEKAAPRDEPVEPVEWGEFGHAPGVQFDDFDAIRKEIEKETERTTGKNKGISPMPILLKIFSPHVIDLTLVDLPGITKVPVGDQPQDIEIQIRRMIFSFITKPNCIILAVTAANTDLANSDALKMARDVDPEGRRTLGVLTKCDLMDADTDAMEMLLGKVYPLRLGYVGVVCRSQKDINKKTDIRDAIKEEERFFRTHPSYRLISHRCGTRHLSVLLNQILMHHIQETLPELKHTIHLLLQEYESELTTYGDTLVEVQGNPGALLLHFFSKFARNFQDAIEGRLNLMNCSDQLTGGARINYIFHDWFGKALSQFDPLDGLSDLEIRTAIRNATGPKASLFVPEGAFEILVRKQIAKLEAPALQCVEQVYDELQKIIEKCDLPEMSRFSCLRDRLMEVVRNVLKRCLHPTNQMISNLIQMELAYFNTNHPDFVGGSQAAQVANQTSYPFKATSMNNRDLDFRGQLQDAAAANNLPSSQQLPPQQQQYPQQHQRQQQQQQQGQQHPQSMQSQLRQITPSPPNNTGSTATTTPEHYSVNPQIINQSTEINSGLPSAAQQQQQQPPATGFLSFFKGTRGNSISQPQSNFQSMSSHPPPQQQQHLEEMNNNWYQTSQTTNYDIKKRLQQHHGTRSSSNPTTTPSFTSSFGIGLRLPQVPNIVIPDDNISEREKVEIELIKSLIISYFNIVRKNVADYVPKSIMSFMVNTAKDVIQRELVSQLYKDELFEELLKEGDDIAEARRLCKTTLKTLRTAMEIVNQIRDFDLDE